MHRTSGSGSAPAGDMWFEEGGKDCSSWRIAQLSQVLQCCKNAWGQGDAAAAEGTGPATHLPPLAAVLAVPSLVCGCGRGCLFGAAIKLLIREHIENM